MEISRHFKKNIIVTDFDPIEDLMDYAIVLQSRGYTEDLLRELHGFTSNNEIKLTSKAISLHINTFEGLANQALSSPNNTSYLSFYYACLNLIKVNLLVNGKRTQLKINRHHGASYYESEMSKLFLNEKIKLINRGTINLSYSSLSTNIIANTGLQIKLNDIYKYITSVGAEYLTVTGKNQPFLMSDNKIVGDDANGYFIKVKPLEVRHLLKPPRANLIKSFRGLKVNKQTSEGIFYESEKVLLPFNDAKPHLLNLVNRSLLIDVHMREPNKPYNWSTMSPLTGSQHVFSEELYILMAYFHLSNVVRYNPEHLNKLMNSKYWLIISALRKHGFLQFLKIICSNIRKESMAID